MINEGQFSDLVVALMEQTLSQAPAEMRELITPHVEAKLQKLVRTQLFHFMGKLDDKQKRLFIASIMISKKMIECGMVPHFTEFQMALFTKTIELLD
mgnify:CR=1 FL=1